MNQSVIPHEDYEQTWTEQIRAHPCPMQVSPKLLQVNMEQALSYQRKKAVKVMQLISAKQWNWSSIFLYFSSSPAPCPILSISWAYTPKKSKEF